MALRFSLFAVLISLGVFCLSSFVLAQEDFFADDGFSTFSSEDDSNSLLPEFRGYTCTQDCSGHRAGYEWAEERGIDDVDDCGGKSNSFIEGCQAYVEENGL